MNDPATPDPATPDPATPDPAAGEAAPSSDPEAEEEESPGLLRALLGLVNAPLLGRPRWVRDLVGFAGVETLAVALCLIAYGLAGGLALAIAAVPLGLATLAVFYWLFLHPSDGEGPSQGGEGDPEPAR